METSSTLLIRVRNTGDAASWREFVAIYEPLIIAYARKKQLSGSAALDVAQEVFVRLLKALPRFQFDRSQGRFRTWLWQVTNSVIVEGMRRQGRQNNAERRWRECGPEGDVPEDWRRMVQRRVLEHALQKVKAEVSPRSWACFSEHLLLGRPAAEVAAQLETNSNAVYVNASRVLARVREACTHAMGELSDEPDDLSN